MDNPIWEMSSGQGKPRTVFDRREVGRDLGGLRPPGSAGEPRGGRAVYLL